jgi:hypothetical protein
MTIQQNGYVTQCACVRAAAAAVAALSSACSSLEDPVFATSTHVRRGFLAVYVLAAAHTRNPAAMTVEAVAVLQHV